MWFDANRSKSRGTAWPAPHLHWHFASLQAPSPTRQPHREVAEDRGWARASPTRTTLGWLQQLTELLRMVLPDTAAVGACPGLVLPANGSESRPTTAQQRRAAGGRKISRLSDISAKCLHNPFLPVASSGHGPASSEVPGQETHVPLSQASVSFTDPDPVALFKCYRKHKSH